MKKLIETIRNGRRIAKKLGDIRMSPRTMADDIISNISDLPLNREGKMKRLLKECSNKNIPITEDDMVLAEAMFDL